MYCSVEEIVTEAVMKILIGASCKFHPCGREDIDVRCLGEQSGDRRACTCVDGWIREWSFSTALLALF
jgi:hypothetical protein